MCVEVFARPQRRLAERGRRGFGKVYPDLAKNVRLERFGGLLMPHFDTPVRDEATLALIEECLRERFVPLNLMHGDVRWRNVGVYKKDGRTKAVVLTSKR